MRKQNTLAFKVFVGIACFVGFLTILSESSRSQSEKQIFLTKTVPPVQPKPIHLEAPEVMAKEPRMEPALLDHTELQAMTGYLYYEILPGRGVRFRYDELRDERMGHFWLLKRPRDLRGKTVRIDYQGYVPREMTFRIAKSGTSAAIVKKVKVEDSPYKSRSIFIDIPNTIPFKEVKFFEFWIERESAERSHGDFMIEKIIVLEKGESDEPGADESRPEPYPFEKPFIPTNLVRAGVRAT